MAIYISIVFTTDDYRTALVKIFFATHYDRRADSQQIKKHRKFKVLLYSRALE